MKKSSRTGPNPIQNAPKSHARASFFRKIPEVADGCRHGRSAQFLHSYSSSLPGSRFNTQALWGLYEWIPAEPVSRVLHTLTNKRDEACTSSTWIDETNRWTNHSLPSTKSELLLNYCFTGNQSDNICGNCCSLLSTHGYLPWYMQHPNLTHQSMGVDYIKQRFWRVSIHGRSAHIWGLSQLTISFFKPFNGMIILCSTPTSIISWFRLGSTHKICLLQPAMICLHLTANLSHDRVWWTTVL